MHFVEMEFSGVLTPTRRARCAMKNIMMATMMLRTIE